MKKTLLAIIMLAYSLSTWAQEDVTRFLGIPVDGTKREMIEKLKAKGFEPHPIEKNWLIGEFNGQNVTIEVQTQNNKVWRIIVAEAIPRDAIDIKRRFNELCHQFLRNKRYFTQTLECDLLIPDEENIQRNIRNNKKRYEAIFYQLSPKNIEDIEFSLETRYKDLQKICPQDRIEVMKLLIRREEITKYIVNKKTDKNIVWFTIAGTKGKYYILMYYENQKNQANGEDL